MKILVLVAMTLAVAHATSVERAQHPLKSAFQKFVRKYARNYSSPVEERKRFQHFVENLNRAAQLQKVNPHAIFGVTQFSDLSQEEFRSRYLADMSGLQKRRDANPVKPIFNESELRSRSGAIDWRDYGAVTYVKNQQNCGGCWSFSSTGSIEGQWVIAGQQSLVALSEQNLISCDTTDSGCNGGMMDNAWAWLISAQGGQIATEDSDPFVSGSGTAPACSTAGVTWGATITSSENLPSDESQMASWMDNNGPISIGIDGSTFRHYQSNGGIITNCINQQLNHAVLTVGYNASSTPPYWIVKNSWGPEWGVDGYAYVEMFKNECLISSAPCTSVVGSGNDWHVKKRPAKIKAD